MCAKAFLAAPTHAKIDHSNISGIAGNFVHTSGGDTVSGDLSITGSLSAGSVSATTYYNLPADPVQVPSAWAGYIANADVSGNGQGLAGFSGVSATQVSATSGYFDTLAGSAWNTLTGADDYLSGQITGNYNTLTGADDYLSGQITGNYNTLTGADNYLSGQITATSASLSAWATKEASTNISGGGYGISNLSGMSATYLSGTSATLSNNLSAAALIATTSAGIGLSGTRWTITIDPSGTMNFNWNG